MKSIKLILGILLTVNLSFAQEIPIDIVYRVNAVNYIFEGTVINSQPYYNSNGDYIYTSNTVEISKILKGEISCGTIEIITEGGQVGGQELEVSHALQLIEGSVGIFLCTQTDMPLSVIDFYPETNIETLEATYENQSFIRYWWDGQGINAADLWLNYDSLMLVYNVTETISGLTYIDCYDSAIAPPFLSTIANQEQSIIPEKEEIFPSYSKIEFDKQIEYADFKRKNFLEVKASRANDKIFYNLANLKISGSTQKYLEFDVTIKDDIGTKYLDQSAIRLKYDTAIFGQNIVANTNLLVTRGSINSDPNCYSAPTPSDKTYNAVLITAFEKIYSQCKKPLLTTPQTLMHLKIKIKHCEQLGGIELEDTASFFGPSLILIYSAYADFPNDTFQTDYANIDHSQFELKPDCRADITDFNPKIVAGGIGDTLTIIGNQFGATRGSGSVYFKNANDGGNSDAFLDNADYISWSDTLIKVFVPSYDSAIVGGTAEFGQPAGTGFFKVVANDATFDYSPTQLTIKYSIRNNKAKSPSILTPWSSFNKAFVFHCDSAVAAYKNGSMKAVIDKALRDWTCLTGINWYLGNDTVSLGDSVKIDTLCIIKFAPNLNTNKLAITTSYMSACSGEPITLESDIRINSNYNWYCDTVYGSFVPPLQRDFYAVILHELGHAHGLKHVIDTGAIMHYSVSSGVRKINLNTDNSCDEGGNWIMDYSTATANQVTCSGILNISRIINPPCIITNGIAQGYNDNATFSVFPNPTTNILSIQPNSAFETTINILLIDISGKIIIIESYSKMDGIETIDLTSLPNGIYILKIQDTKNQIIETFKISKL